MKKVNEFFEMLPLYNVCEGNTRYEEVVKKKVDKGSDLTFIDKQGKVATCIESPAFNQINPDKLTIRHLNCELVIILNVKLVQTTDVKFHLQCPAGLKNFLRLTIQTSNIYLTRQQ
uniref:Uncharacterized protein n=1 Tax=Clytia hemisphaerica TaxID=252671 RepID=A0A7M5UKM9_9CNID